MASENWKPVPGFEGLYEISDLGRVRRGERVLRTYEHRGGYRRIGLYKKGSARCLIGVHRLVCEAFCGARPDGHEVNHINNDRSDNRAANLEWVTRKQNLAHREKFGTDPVMDRNPNAKLSRSAVLGIRAKFASGELQRVLAAEHGVTQALISAVVLRKCWNDI